MNIDKGIKMFVLLQGQLVFHIWNSNRGPAKVSKRLSVWVISSQAIISNFGSLSVEEKEFPNSEISLEAISGQKEEKSLQEER